MYSCRKQWRHTSLPFSTTICSSSQHITSTCVSSESYRYEFASDRTCGMGKFSHGKSFPALPGRKAKLWTNITLSKIKISLSFWTCIWEHYWLQAKLCTLVLSTVFVILPHTRLQDLKRALQTFFVEMSNEPNTQKADDRAKPAVCGDTLLSKDKKKPPSWQQFLSFLVSFDAGESL